ncbi:uncharacterized protein MYCFIDRAFT_200760 [Pseudocercospora fijiensis CIRAD86]|uniref:Uncharacterized protein n=1 Tax=Pseudocercospora fijiensis (strain CIRAD86) TaxID=383855 RepID=M3AI28_PSEFD|nr:uncharacterized protein MYCFIDRAFT_200760 [Pseudocercospora fijiensis CIRAD86]EME77147.1 hypothetical protein MYCFIDRAFT_200760 [Pseudocercospora fijiensis CIRAD86]
MSQNRKRSRSETASTLSSSSSLSSIDSLDDMSSNDSSNGGSTQDSADSNKRISKRPRIYSASPSSYRSPTFTEMVAFANRPRRFAKLPIADSFQSDFSAYPQTTINHLATLVAWQSCAKSPKKHFGLGRLHQNIDCFVSDFDIDNDVVVVAMMLLTRRGTPTSDTRPLELFQTAVILAKKVLDDSAPRTKIWAKRLGMDKKALTDLEYRFCFEIDWRFGVEEGEWASWNVEIGKKIEFPWDDQDEDGNGSDLMSKVEAFWDMESKMRMELLMVTQTGLAAEVIAGQLELLTWVEGLF